ncbi:MAG: hypothetical protein ACOYJB_10115 [Christensenellaceae bacterium]|jgi:predicted site-specific integrase-resolvase
MPEKKLVKLSEVSRRIGVNYQRLFYAVASGKIPAETNETGSRWFVNESDIPKIKSILRA